MPGRDPTALTKRTFDLLIIGGGIVGAGIARDAAMRGLSVALIDKGDFAGGTSSRSSKLIHGGFRYLEQHDFGLVVESCRERRVLQEIAPNRVKPLPFLLPVYRENPRPLWKMRLGMTLYDLLALYRNTQRHRTLGAKASLDLEPSLNPNDLLGAIHYFDCQEDDARFCVDNILDSAANGATCANYCEATAVLENEGSVRAVRALDQVGGESFEIAARVIINAAGPWVDRVQKMVGNANTGTALNPTKGVHLLLPRVMGQHAICFQGRRDGRIMFLLPWHDCSLLGTTDTDFRGDPSAVRADVADVDYLLDELAALVPQSRLSQADVITTFAGVRALVASDAANPSARSREHRIAVHGKNMISVAGGKYTTYRLIAAQAVDEGFRLLGKKSPPCRTGKTPLYTPTQPRQGIQLSNDPMVFAGDVLRACRDEMAISVSDVMYRRTGLALSKSGGKDTAGIVSEVMSEELAWTDEQSERSLAKYLTERSPAF